MRNIEKSEEVKNRALFDQESGKKLMFRKTGKNKLLSENRQKIIEIILGDRKKKSDLNDNT